MLVVNLQSGWHSLNFHWLIFVKLYFECVDSVDKGLGFRFGRFLGSICF